MVREIYSVYLSSRSLLAKKIRIKIALTEISKLFVATNNYEQKLHRTIKGVHIGKIFFPPIPFFPFLPHRGHENVFLNTKIVQFLHRNVTMDEIRIHHFFNLQIYFASTALFRSNPRQLFTDLTRMLQIRKFGNTWDVFDPTKKLTNKALISTPEEVYVDE